MDGFTERFQVDESLDELIGHVHRVGGGEPQSFEVVAIGNPFGLEGTLTLGIISALGRTIPALTTFSIPSSIQTDAAINPGNSGGPLLNSLGQLVGVNTAIYSPSGASAGIGFAIPADTVRWVVSDLIRYGRLVRPTIGVEISVAGVDVHHVVAFDETVEQVLVGRIQGVINPE